MPVGVFVYLKNLRFNRYYALFALPKTLIILCFTIYFIIVRASPKY